MKQAFRARLLVTALVLLATWAPAAAATSSATSEFLLAKLAASEGAVAEALAGYERAEQLDAHSPYIRLEHAQLLARMTQVVRRPSQQTEDQKKAIDLVHQALAAEPENPDVLRGAGAVYVALAGRDAGAMQSAREVYERVVAQDPGDAQSALLLGRIYLEQQNPAQAAKVFREVIERAPAQRAAYGLLVEALLQAQKSREAEAALQDLLRLDPDSLEARLTLAEIQSQREDHAAALATLTAATEPSSADPRLRRQLAWAYYLTGDLEHALAVAIPLAEADPDDVQINLLEGLVFSAQGRNADAVDRLSRVRAKRPLEAPLALALTRVLEREGKVDQAAATMTELITELGRQGKTAEQDDARLELAQIYVTAKQWDKAEAAVQPLLEKPVNGAAEPSEANAAPKSPDDKKTVTVRASAALPPALAARLLAADCVAEKKDFDRALALVPENETAALVVAKRGELLLKAGREAEGKVTLDKLTSSNDAKRVMAAAEAYQRLERYQDSIAPLERLVARDPQSVPAGFLLAAAYERTGKREESVAQFRRILAIEPNFHAALNYLGYMFAERGENLAEARKLIERAVALEPDNGAYVDSLGWVYFRQGEYERARSTLERATHLETADPTVQEHLGDVYGALGEAARASEAYRRAIALTDPAKSDELRRKLDQLVTATPHR